MAAGGSHGVASKRDELPAPGGTVYGGSQLDVLRVQRKRWRAPRLLGGARVLPAGSWRGGANGAPGRNDTHIWSSGVTW